MYVVLSYLVTPVFFLPQEKAIWHWYACVTQPRIALWTKPRRVCVLVSDLKTAIATSSLVSTTGFIRDLQREVLQRTRTNGTTTMTSSPTTAVFTNKLLHKPYAKLFEDHTSCRTKMFLLAGCLWTSQWQACCPSTHLQWPSLSGVTLIHLWGVIVRLV